ncbi:larval cuticle protein 65Ag1-like [Drosophila innubila]|uniref:larval cuticle protein 65Ag1-like n=1 Tax=Drosophila innubila TaxID=198719 RepID=UPI00148D9BE2|nr:larval cuticle protein 65Ag1-like [Drosophila innubila]
MKFLIVFVALFAVALAAHADTEIVRSESDVGPESYSYSFETSDGQSAQEQGELENPGSEHEAISVHGSYKYIGDDGQTYEITYVADENGFQPQGSHIPK